MPKKRMGRVRKFIRMRQMRAKRRRGDRETATRSASSRDNA
jgi:hypothetical protein